MEYEIRNADELTHWGIKGMKWGVRRYQNKDGSLTPAGKKRRTKQDDATSAAEYYKNQRNEIDKYHYQNLEKHGKLGEKKWREAVAKGYKGNLEDWFETEMWKDREMVNLQNQIDSNMYKYRNLDRKHQASLAYAEALAFKNSDRIVDKMISDGIWKEGKDAVDNYLDMIGRNVPKFTDEAPDSPEVRKLSALSTNKNSYVTTRDRAAFSWDSEGTEEAHWNEKLSSKNAGHVKKIAKELDEFWNRAIKDADGDEFSDEFDGHSKYYYDTYVKNDKEAYAKAVLEDVEYWRAEREKVAHSDQRADELTHWGIKGMRWGVRRYQNKDGSLTPAGKKRYDSDDETADVPKKKSVKDMSDAELDRAIIRARKEDEYNRLRPEQAPGKTKLMNRLVDEVVVPAAMTSGKKFLENALNKAGEDLLKGKVDPDSIEVLKKTFEKLDYKQKIDKINNPDKYLSEEDKNKRQEREFKAEDRAAKKEGYVDAADKAAKIRESEEATRKADATEKARAANEAKSKEYYESVYSQVGGERGRVNPNESLGLTIYNKPVSDISTKTVSGGKSFVDSFMNDNSYDLIDTNGEVIFSWGNGDDD